jgi:hypothetical protein
MLQVLESRENGATLEIASDILQVLGGKIDLDPSHFRFTMLFHYKPSAPLSLQLLYEGFAKQHPKGYGILGKALFSELHSSHVETQKVVCFFGVVTPPKSHTHGALLHAESLDVPKGFSEFFQTLQDLPIASTRHLLTPSTIQEGTFALFPIA